MTTQLFQPIQNPVYITPSQIRRIIGTQDQSTNDDDILLSFCEELSRKIDWECDRNFFPRYQTLKLDWPGASFSLNLPDDLITLVTLTNGDGNAIPATSGSTTVIYYYPPSEYPRYKIQLGINSGYVFLFSGTPQQSISVNALWGYPAYENTGIWNVSTSATVQDTTQQNATQTTLLVQTGSFQAGQTLYIGDEFEVIQSVATATTNDTLTVLRGACGSTAAVHANGVAIKQILVHPTIFRAAERLVAWAYRKKDDANYGTVGIQSTGLLVLPREMPEDVVGILKNLRRGHV